MLRIWDMFFCEGERVLLQVALAIMTIHADELLKTCPTLQELMQFLLHIPEGKLYPHILVPAIESIKIKDSELAALHETDKPGKKK